MNLEHKRKYGVPVAARVKLEVANEIKEQAALRNQSLAQYLCKLITDATAHQRDVRRMLQAVVTELAEGGMSICDIEATMQKVNKKLQSKQWKHQ
jgi:hypothetical protein